MDTGDRPDSENEPDQHTRDAHHTYSLVDALTRGQRRRIDGLEAKFDATIAALDDRVVAALDRVVDRLDQVDGRMIGAMVRMDEIEERLTARLEGLETSIAELLQRLPAER